MAVQEEDLPIWHLQRLSNQTVRDALRRTDTPVCSECVYGSQTCAILRRTVTPQEYEEGCGGFDCHINRRINLFNQGILVVPMAAA